MASVEISQYDELPLQGGLIKPVLSFPRVTNDYTSTGAWQEGPTAVGRSIRIYVSGGEASFALASSDAAKLTLPDGGIETFNVEPGSVIYYK